MQWMIPQGSVDIMHNYLQEIQSICDASAVDKRNISCYEALFMRFVYN